MQGADFNQETKDLLERINRFLREEFNYKKFPAFLSHSGNISANQKYFDLYIRGPFVPKGDPVPQNSIVIASINFYNKRQGWGTEFLKMLKEYCLFWDIDYIVIESAHTEAVKEFAKKKNFLQMEGTKDWLAHVKDIDV
ncbi:hypothetical protein [Thiohalorhabdus methylotrophus]|uniref:N-acetyltransferase domain-containing protein n=1 Tax=Thiohalorhabdus methylotrophus TaxID=3242694 RepID=A0ABV4U169_9GAMM